MRTLALTIAYDGTNWAGFQRQTRFPSIQAELEGALGTVFQHAVEVNGAGRTDAGVHAMGQVISLSTRNPMPITRIPSAVNRLLPASIRVRRVAEVDAGFHARRSARYRRYWYVLQTTRWPDPVRGRFQWQITSPLDTDAMERALCPLVGRHDFAAFCHGGAGNLPKMTIRTLQRAQVRRCGTCIVIDVQADAFLHQMVRLLVANLVAIGRHDRPVHWLEMLLQQHDRHAAGKGAPPCGLFLMRVGYPGPEMTPMVGDRWRSEP